MGGADGGVECMFLGLSRPALATQPGWAAAGAVPLPVRAGVRRPVHGSNGERMQGAWSGILPP